jgi:hypothetical protein
MLAWPAAAGAAWRPRVAGAAALAGAALILWSLLCISKQDHFPGLLALPPTLGTALLIQAGRCRYAGIGLLTHPAPVAIGKVSYSAYLWHWPLIALWQYGYGAPGMAPALLLLVLTFALAALSYRLVEVPARRSSAALLPLALRQFVLPGGLAGIAAVALVYGTQWLPGTLDSTYRKELARLSLLNEPAHAQPYVCHRKRLSESDVNNAQCVLGGSDGQVKVLLWGDSNAAHYVGLLGEFTKHADLRFRNFEVGSCPPLLGDPAPFIEARRLDDCRSSLELVRGQLAQYDAIILAASWSQYQERSPQFLAALRATVTELTAQGKKVILLGKIPEVPGVRRACPMKALTYPALDCQPAGAAMKPEIAAANAYLRELASLDRNVAYFDANDYLCENGVCLAHEPDGDLRYVDTSHLTMRYSWQLGGRIIAAEGVPAVFRQLQ